MFPEDSHLRRSANWVPQLLGWYDTHKRDFPWRQHLSVYWTWICEVMSQQTTMAVVVPRFREFVKALPDVQSLANCSDDVLRQLWAGLGYYARARNLRKGAQYIVSELGGCFPADYESWLKVPGVGPYTASVISSICFKEARACVDGNVIRVIARLTGCSSVEIWSDAGRKWIQALTDDVIDCARPGAFNQAMMALGATLCQKKSPECHLCPVRDVCRAFQMQKVHACPANKPRKQFESVELAALRISALSQHVSPQEQILLVERKKGFLSETVGFPLLKQAEHKKLAAWLGAHELVDSLRVSEDTLSHTITHHQLQVRIFDVELSHQQGAAEDFAAHLLIEFSAFFDSPRWVSKSLTESGVASSLDRKIWENISLF